MRNLLVALIGFLVGGAAIATVALALPRTTVASSPTHMGQATGMSSGMMNASATRSAATMMSSTQPVKLTIQHVQRGCHVWSNGKTTATMMRLHLKQGQRLVVMDVDVDAHQMMQFSGPAKLHMGGPMMMSHSMTMTFTKKGTYRLGTKTVEMPGAMDVKTIGPDNKLRLVVTVA
jgi:hypothetical protein